MNNEIVLHQGIGITKDEWRLQWRNWGTWLVGLFLLAVVVSEHPVWSSHEFSVLEAASIWADRVSLVGSLVAMLTVPFALDRVRRQRVTPIEFSKPFEKLAYVVGKFAGAVLPLAVVTAMSMAIHLTITLATQQDISLITAGTSYLRQAVFIAFVPLLYATTLTYCLSVYIRRPVIIIPLFLSYLIMTTATQAAADAKFSWFSPIVRPEYFGGIIPAESTPAVLTHQIVYLSLSAGLLALAVNGFQRKRFSREHSFVWRNYFRFPVPFHLSVNFRILWGGHIVAALLMAFVAITNTMSNPQTDAILRADYALFGLEFYLPISGLLILAGVVAHDKGVGTLDMLLTRPVNRWRLMIERLLPALAIYGTLCLLAVYLLHALYQSLPIPKALLVSLSTGIYLGLVGMTIANITQSALAGYGAGLIYWFFEAAFDGRITAPLYLLIVSNQIPPESGEVWQNPSIWLPVKVGVLILGAWLFVLNGWLFDVGHKRRKAITILVVSIPVIFALGWWLIPVFV
jgi:ABC-type transport system involved in multi-copper enzyme maturation permease subunit